MCIKIFNTEEELSYNSHVPLEDQIKGARHIVINYEPSDPSIDRFLGEMERLYKNGISAKMNIKVIHNNHVNGVKVRNDIIKLLSELDINEVIKIMTSFQAETDKKLEELANLCRVK